MNRIHFILPHKNILITQKLIVVFFCLCLPLYCFSSINIKQQSENKLVVSVNFKESFFSESITHLPLIKKPFFVLSEDKEISFNILKKIYYNHSFSKDQLTEDIPLGLDESDISTTKDLTVDKLLTSTYVCKYENRHLWRINLHSYDYQVQKCMQSMDIEISGERVSLLSDSLFYANLNKIVQNKTTKPIVHKADEYILTGKSRNKLFISHFQCFEININGSGWQIFSNRFKNQFFLNREFRYG